MLGKAIWRLRIQENPSAAGALPRTPLRELTALPQTSLLVGRGWLSTLQEPHHPALGPSVLASSTPTPKLVPTPLSVSLTLHKNPQANCLPRVVSSPPRRHQYTAELRHSKRITRTVSNKTVYVIANDSHTRVDTAVLHRNCGVTATTTKQRRNARTFLRSWPNIIGVARITNWGKPKMDKWNELPIKHFWFYLYGFRIKGLCI